MPKVGIRELRDNLSRYISAVQDGAEVIVTDNGEAVARIVPHNRPGRLESLIEEGLVTPAVDNSRSLPPLIKASGPVSPLIVEQRR